ncbi:MAG: acyl-CoA dehydrogenase family protein [Sphingomonas sp.]|nr:acyl-CoA dehydrogenase family protein [Sphingomonas sp.]
MNFGFDEDQKSLADTVAQQLADFPRLTAPELMPLEDDSVWRALADLGLFALLVPERNEGIGLSLVDLALAVEALGAGLAPPSVVSTLIATDAIARHGSDLQQRALLPKIAVGQLKVAIALLESDAGYGADAVRTAFTAGTLRGEKILVADAAAADLLLVVARGEDGPVIIMVDPGAPGVTLRPHDDLDPSSGHCAVMFDRVKLGDDAVLGQAAPARAVDRLLDVAATLHAGLAMGIAGLMLDKAVEYAKTRVQFGQAIGAFQAIKHRCADMAVAVEAGRSAAYYAFWTAAEETPDRARASSMAKAYCGDVARHVCNETIQVHGGMGFTWELGLHRFLRRSKVIEHAYGDAAWHNERILSATLATMNAAPRRDQDAA